MLVTLSKWFTMALNMEICRYVKIIIFVIKLCRDLDGIDSYFYEHNFIACILSRVLFFTILLHIPLIFYQELFSWALVSTLDSLRVTIFNN